MSRIALRPSLFRMIFVVAVAASMMTTLGAGVSASADTGQAADHHAERNITQSDAGALATELRQKAEPFVVLTPNHAVLLPEARRILTPSENTVVAQSIASYNAAPNPVSKSGYYDGQTVTPASLHRVHKAALPRPGCNWSWHWTPHWYDHTFWMNMCAASVIDGWLWAVGGTAATIAALQGFMDVPYDIAAIVAGVAGGLGAGGLAAQMSTCSALHYSGVGYGILYAGAAYLYC